MGCPPPPFQIRFALRHRDGGECQLVGIWFATAII
jgi:hypothetical protein